MPFTPLRSIALTGCGSKLCARNDRIGAWAGAPVVNLRLYNHRHQGCVGGDPKVSQPGTFNSGTAMQGQYREPLIESITISDSNAATSPVVPSNTSPKTATCSA
ncbi:hypothetical protein GBJ32_04730 [Bifidobacterium longum]|uniref:Uncharacterized protein n=5 Tax=Bacteria TaxID=2 RepID=A0A6C9EIV4_ECOLX|nr:hypothetical protein BL0661 [Bifidobacterium longum NCC2705]KAB1943348.1 hypothetical protein F8277_10310 [Bifidobacterium longum subsp. infantis]KAB5323553.1 hypothetical protein F9950_18125 [Bacteroides stercoris]KAB6720312.1 hypothetical protein GBL36_08355 [Bifidobacterium longum]MBD3900703.1 hypothetical protein [Bifidobacterium longum subsp. longum]MSB31020.1 hypothetical protein [Ligilactobacillus ruminis]MSD82827.1 hypothetical protein [Escherichia coli]